MSFINNVIIKNNLKKYNISESKFYIMKINTIIYNKKSHYVSKFKDFLFVDDLSEFLLKYYKINVIYIFFNNLLFNNKQIIYPCFLDKNIMKIMLNNQKQKKRLLKITKNENQENINKDFSNILNKLNSTSTIIEFSNFETLNSETTIDNINVNDDITISIDLRINKKYDFQFLQKKINFIEEKNSIDKTILNIINELYKTNDNNDNNININNNNKKIINLNSNKEKNNIELSKVKIQKAKMNPKKIYSKKNTLNNNLSIESEKERKLLSKQPIRRRTNSINLLKRQNSYSKLYLLKSLNFNLSEYKSREKMKINLSYKTQSFSTYYNSKLSNESKYMNKTKNYIKDKIPIKQYYDIFGKSKKIIKAKSKNLSIKTENFSPLLTPKNLKKRFLEKNEKKNNNVHYHTNVFNPIKKISNNTFNSIINSPYKNSKEKKFIISLNKAKKIYSKLNESLNSNKKC